MTRKTSKSASKIIRRIAIVAVSIIVIGSGVFIYLRMTSQNSTTGSNTNSLQTAKATVGDLILFASGTGTIQPAAQSNLSFNTDGQVSEINVKVGDRVKAGQILAQLDDTNAKISLAQAQDAMDKLTSPAAIATAEQTLADGQASLVSAKATLEHFISPEVLYWEEQVADRQQIASDAQAADQANPSDATQQKAAAAKTSLKYAQDMLVHFQNVYKYDYIPATFTQYRTIRTRTGTRTEVIQVEDTTTGKMVDLIYAPTQGEIGAARAAYESAKASIAEAQTYLDVIKGADIPEGATGANLVTYLKTKDALETAQYNLKAIELIAPIDGTVSAININVGDLATTGSSVLTISNLDQPYVLDAYIDAKDWGQIRIGYEVDATFNILPDQSFKGAVTNVYPTLDTTSANSTLVHFTARLNGPISYNLPAGSSTSVNVVGGRAENVVLVPVEALHAVGDGQYALFVMENGKIRLRVVQVGLMDLTKAEIISDLKASDIVTTGVVKTK